MRIGYAKGYEAGRVSSFQEFERVLAILREENADLRRDRDLQISRADAAADLLLQHIGARAISLAGKQEESERSERQVKAVSALASIPDPTDDLPLGHPRGLYRNAAEASLAGDDVSGMDG